MKPDPPPATGRVPLAALQRWMLAVITSPGEVPDAEIAARVKPSAALSPAARAATYQRAYQARLLGAFQDMFPALRRAVGDELLDAFALDYLAAHPPRSFTLSDLAARFPEHLAATRPDRDAPPDRREAWPDFLIELASLERAVLEVAEGPGLETGGLPDARPLLSMPPEQLLGIRLVPSPCLRLFEGAFPVHRYVQAVRRGGAPDLPEPRRSWFALTRRRYRVVLHDLSPAQHAFLGACDGSRTIESALPSSAAPDTGNLRDWLCDWTALGFFRSFERRGP